MTNDAAILECLQSIDQQLRVLVRLNSALLLMQGLADKTERRAFALTGEMKRDDICSLVGVSATTLSELWSKWYSLGLLVKDGNSYKKAVD